MRMTALLCLLALASAHAAIAADRAEWLAMEQLPDMDGVERPLLAADEPRTTVLVFWTPWCSNCQKESPALVLAAKTYAGRAQFLGIVSGDDQSIDMAKVKDFISRNGLTYPCLRDRELRVTNRLNVQGTPTIIVVRPNGEITYQGHHPPEAWDEVL